MCPLSSKSRSFGISESQVLRDSRSSRTRGMYFDIDLEEAESKKRDKMIERAKRERDRYSRYSREEVWPFDSRSMSSSIRSGGDLTIARVVKPKLFAFD